MPGRPVDAIATRTKERSRLRRHSLESCRLHRQQQRRRSKPRDLLRGSPDLGRYCGEPDSAATWRLHHGGGGFSSTSGNNYVVSNSGGVFIYNTSDPSHPTGTGAAASFNLANGNTLANLVAPSSGTFAGVVLYQDRTLSPQPDISITGGNALHILDGLVYAPGANFNVQGGTPASTTIGGSLIVNSISMIGASSLIVQNPATPVPTAACQTFAYVPIGWQDF